MSPKFKLGQRVKLVSKKGWTSATSSLNVNTIFVINKIDSACIEGPIYSKDDAPFWCSEEDLIPVNLIRRRNVRHT